MALTWPKPAGLTVKGQASKVAVVIRYSLCRYSLIKLISTQIFYCVTWKTSDVRNGLIWKSAPKAIVL